MTTLRDYLRDFMEEAVKLGQDTENQDTLEADKENLLDDTVSELVERFIGA